MTENNSPRNTTEAYGEDFIDLVLQPGFGKKDEEPESKTTEVIIPASIHPEESGKTFDFLFEPEEKTVKRVVRKPARISIEELIENIEEERIVIGFPAIGHARAERQINDPEIDRCATIAVHSDLPHPDLRALINSLDHKHDYPVGAIKPILRILPSGKEIDLPSESNLSESTYNNDYLFLLGEYKAYIISKNGSISVEEIIEPLVKRKAFTSKYSKNTFAVTNLNRVSIYRKAGTARDKDTPEMHFFDKEPKSVILLPKDLILVTTNNHAIYSRDFKEMHSFTGKFDFNKKYLAHVKGENLHVAPLNSKKVYFTKHKIPFDLNNAKFTDICMSNDYAYLLYNTSTHPIVIKYIFDKKLFERQRLNIGLNLHRLLSEGDYLIGVNYAKSQNGYSTNIYKLNNEVLPKLCSSDTICNVDLSRTGKIFLHDDFKIKVFSKEGTLEEEIKKSFNEIYWMK